MKVTVGYPPNYAQINKKFNLRGRHVVFTYGDTLYNPAGNEISDHLMVHEETHSSHQIATTPEKWWDYYLEDSQFRLAVELAAYRAQYKFAKENYNRQNRKGILKNISKDLSSELYGNVISREEAAELIAEDK